MNAKPMRLIRAEPVTTRQQETPQEKALQEVHERRTGSDVPHGQGEIDNTPTANVIQVDDVLLRSFRLTDSEL